MLGQIAQGEQLDVEGDVGARQRPGPAGALARVQQKGVEGRRPQVFRDGVDTAATASGGQPFGVIGGQCQTAFGEEDLQPSGQWPHGAAGQASPLQQGLGMVGMFVVQQPSQMADQAAGST
ncbi:hypothetical protein [Nonomuraea sp. NPDC003201]